VRGKRIVGFHITGNYLLLESMFPGIIMILTKA
jgi:hypothetical protein